MPFKMHTMIYFFQKKNYLKKCVCLPYLKFSDLSPETHLFFIWPYGHHDIIYFRGHQTHYEQIGELSGKIEVEGHPARQVHLRSIRDHTIGIRNWFDFHRYCVHYIHVEEVFGSTVKPV